MRKREIEDVRFNSEGQVAPEPTIKRKKLGQPDLRYSIQYAVIMMGLGLPSHLSGWTGNRTDGAAVATDEVDRPDDPGADDDACLHFES